VEDQECISGREYIREVYTYYGRGEYFGGKREMKDSFQRVKNEK
tara:strand:+ start:207 stop:338 length:132 start_codon:yes stop_codon:yes gene_type:complete